MRFYDDEHERKYNDFCQRMQYLDEYHRAVAYLFSLDTVCREHVEDIFDFDRDVIIIEGLQKGWQTGTSRRTTHLAFNLWNSCCSDGDETYKDKDGYEVELPSVAYTPDHIFCNGYAEYYFEAIRLRFPLYCDEI